MLPDDKKLELEIDRQLKALPELEAPAGLASRVMAALAARAAVPWYRQSWSNWPVALRWSSLTALLGLFGGLCYAGSGLFDRAGASLRDKVSGNTLGLASLWNALNDLAATACAALQHLGTGAVIGIAATLILSYTMFLALGAAYYRLAFPPSKSFRL
jgi:hypothetical protein